MHDILIVVILNILKFLAARPEGIVASVHHDILYNFIITYYYWGKAGKIVIDVHKKI